MTTKDETKTAFNNLKATIEKRQAFETKNPIPPYSTHPTTIDYPDVHGLTLLRYAIRLGDVEAVEKLNGFPIALRR